MTPQLLEPYTVWLTNNDLSANTIDQRRRFLARIVDELDPVTVTAGELSLWLAEYEGWSRRYYLSAFRSVMRFMVDEGHRADDPTATLRRTPLPDVRPYPLLPSTERALLARVSGDVRAWCLLGLRAGLRVHEAAAFSGEHITETRLRVRGKGAKVDVLPTHPDLWELAQHYPRKGPWFPSRSASGTVTPGWISNRAAALLDELGTDGSFHRLRATYGTNLLRDGANIKVVQRLMRHSSLKSTEHYLGVADDEMTAAIGRLGFGRTEAA